MLYIQNQSEQRLKLISGRQLVAIDPGKYVQIADNQADQGQLDQLLSLGLIQVFNRQFVQEAPPPSPPILAAGSDTQVQYNANGVLAGSPGLLFDYSNSTLIATNLAGSGAGLTNLNANNLSFGVVPTAQLGTGVAGPCTLLLGDSSWSSDGSSLSNLNASSLSFGLVQPTLLGSGTTDSSTFLRGDSTWVSLSAFVAGLDTQVQYNSGGVLAGSTALVFNNASGTLTATNLAGSGASLTSLNASNISSGTVGTARLGSGAASADTFLRGDSTWAALGNLAAGSDTQVQYNAAGVLTGSPGLTYNYSAHTLTVANLAGAGTGITNLNANNLSFGTVGVARLGTGTASGTTFLRGDGTWAAPTAAVAPAGADTQVQYNSGGVLSADTGLTYNHLTGTLTATNLAGVGVGITSLNAGNLGSGTVGTARLGSGAASSSTFLRGDNTWATPAGGGVSVAGSDTQVQYNDGGVLAGSSGLTFNSGTATLTATNLVGAGTALTALNAGNLASGTVPTARLGSGTASSSTFLRGDNTWAAAGATASYPYGTQTYGRPWMAGIKDVTVVAGGTHTLLDTTGGTPGPGYIDQFWIGINDGSSTDAREKSTLSFYRDGEGSPSLVIQTGLLMGLYWGPIGFASRYLGALCYSNSGSGYMAHKIPWTTSMRVVFTNADASNSITLYSDISYKTGATIDWGLAARFLASSAVNISVPAYSTNTLLDVSGTGLFYGLVMYFRGGDGAGNYNYLEGEFKIYIDGETDPSLVWSGTEDYFLQGQYFNDGVLYADNAGCTGKNVNLAQVGAYRFHLDDPIPFTTSIKMTWDAGIAIYATVTNNVTIWYSVLYYLNA